MTVGMPGGPGLPGDAPTPEDVVLQRPFHVRYRAHALGVGLGLAYGLLVRLLVLKFPSEIVALTFVFIFGVPWVIGYLAVWPIPRPTTLQKVFLPWIPWLLAVGVALLTGWEGTACVLMASPAALLMATLGGFLGGQRDGSHSRGRLAAVLALPLALGPVENRVQPATDIRAVETVADIHASPHVVWQHIREVRPIGRAEHGDTLFNRIGFPRAIEAKLFGDGVGAVRHATFEGGVLFIERVTAWEEDRRIAFTIKADPATIPATTLDEHVVVGSRFFDVLDGEYRLEELRPDLTRVHLTSHHRLTMTLAPYARLWSDAILGSVQERIVAVIRARCESAAARRLAER